MKLLIGGSPCTHWSIAQKNHRETEPSGLGWELFKNYKIALEKYQPDFFLYENNKSMAPAIREQITKELGVEPIMINSSLVSAQSRQRLYWTNIPGVAQPQDQGLLLQDILESVTRGGPPTCINPNRNGKARAVDAHMSKLESNLIPRINSPNPARQQYDCIAKPIPVNMTMDGKARCLRASYYKDGIRNMVMTQIDRKTCVAEPVQVAATDDLQVTTIYASAEKKTYTVYEVRNGQVTVKGNQYEIDLPDGYYVIRKLTVTECKRLQTVPESYQFPVSTTQAYKMLGNGWTIDVIAHILGHIPEITTEPLKVLSMYDGMSCGHIALDKLGVDVIKYYAAEIDKFAVQTTQANYPDTIQLGDAFDVRCDDWELPEEETELTDLSDAPEEIKKEVVRNAELLENPGPAKPARKVRVRVRVRHRRGAKA